MNINIGESFVVIIPHHSIPAKIYVDDIKIRPDNLALIHYSYYNYHGKQWVRVIDNEVDFAHLISRKPRRKRKRKKNVVGKGK